LFFFLFARHTLFHESDDATATAATLGFVQSLLFFHAAMFAWLLLFTLARLRVRRTVYNAYHWFLFAVAVFMLCVQSVEIYRTFATRPATSIVVFVAWLPVAGFAVRAARIWYYAFCCCWCDDDRRERRRRQAETNPHSLELIVRSLMQDAAELHETVLGESAPVGGAAMVSVRTEMTPEERRAKFHA
jgi:hypothetical protein